MDSSAPVGCAHARYGDVDEHGQIVDQLLATRVCVVCDRAIEQQRLISVDGVGPMHVGCYDVWSWIPGRSLDDVRLAWAATDRAVDELVGRVLERAREARILAAIGPCIHDVQPFAQLDDVLALIEMAGA